MRFGARIGAAFRFRGSKIIRGAQTIPNKFIFLVKAGKRRMWLRPSYAKQHQLQMSLAMYDIGGGTVMANDVRLTFEQFLVQAFNYEPHRTRGKAIHNLLWAARRDLAQHIDGTNVDPYDDDKRITACLDWLEENWNYDVAAA